MRRQQYNVTQNSTVTIDLLDDQDLNLLLNTAGAGGYVVTFAGVDKWISPTGSAPAQPTTVGRAAEWVFFAANGTTYGEKLSETGSAGSAGATGSAGIVWKRLWTNATTYAINDAVYWAGSSYIALQPSSSTDVQQPDLAPAYWGALAAGSTAGSTAEYVDNFTRANSANISTGAPFAYTAVAGTSTEILSNMCHCSNTTSVEQYVRAEQVLASVDHHAQITLGLWTTTGGNVNRAGALVRYDAAANNGYLAFVTTNSVTHTLQLHKVTAGVNTQLGTVTLPGIPVAGDTVKLTVAGTSLVVHYNGVQKIAVTDSTFATGVRAGFYLQRSYVNMNVSLAELRFGI